ncbi:50S ribosomal protein L29 [Candidatus Bathyarchaeota archaeon A05DMB-2]|jgi:large subunit ribosomal protein L29|nr:50S ribosomal protein L29 [Candidatus Bathyarchaeota archaeon A05DMB-2]
MPILRLKEISRMSPEDRAKKLSELRTELARLKTMIRAGGAVENPARVRELRKTIAKILTVENESKLGLRETKEAPEKKAKPKKEEKKAQ